jgi:hypothetical protein
MNKYRVSLQRGLAGYGCEYTREIVIALPEGVTPDDVVDRLEAEYGDDWEQDLAEWDVDCAEVATSEEVAADTVAEFVFNEKGEVVRLRGSDGGKGTHENEPSFI